MKKRRAAGYSLIELIIAMALASVVLVGIYSIFSSFASLEVDTVKKGAVTGWSLAGIDAMNREIEGANVIVWPTAAGAVSDTLITCMNWSRIQAGPATGGNLNGVGIGGGGGVGRPVMVYYYCYDAAGKVLRRAVSSGGSCPAAGSGPPCTAGGYNFGVYGANNVIATSVYRITSKYTPMVNAGNNVFARDDSLNAVHIQFLVGNPAPTPNTPLAGPAYGNAANPQALAMDTRVSLDRPIGNIPSGD